MQTTTTTIAQQDRQAVEAVWRGNTERYRELVERHERRVFAVAWSRLGDATLAEDATQEAFIRGYRHLALLGDGAKFSGWISTIARHVAIGLGLRHRRELNKRERWALEQPATTELAGEETELCTAETLRQTLTELPAAHRECLVLFYLEDKSGAEAAEALGISETALRVRLHRARAALRERLEERLGESLGQLRPAKPIAPSVMVAILSSSTAKTTAGAGIGAKVLSSLAKTSLFSWFTPLISIIGVLPGLGLAWWLGNVERRNYREADGFRAHLHRGFYRSLLWGFPLLVVLITVLNRSALATWGIKGMYLVTGCLVSLLTLISARLLTIHRNPFQVGMFAYCAIITVGVFAQALGWIPLSLSQLPLIVATVLFALVLKHRPARMDYSLFLRAAQGLLKVPEPADDSPQGNRFDRQSLLAFARFVGSRWLASNFRWETRGLALRLPPVKTTFAGNMVVTLVPMSRRCSFVSLGWDGTVAAHCGETDALKLAVTDRRELENLVAKTVSQAWQEFRAGNHESAARALGQVPESEVFVVPVGRDAATRWWRRIVVGWVIVAVLLGALLFLRLPRMGGLKPVDVAESEIRAALAELASDERLTHGWYYSFVLPPTNLFATAGLQAMRQKIFREAGFDAQLDKATQLDRATYPPLVKAIAAGWVSWENIGLTPDEMAKYLRPTQEAEWCYSLRQLQYYRDGKPLTVPFLTELTLWQFRWLRDLNRLDMADRETLVAQLRAMQKLSGDIRGLFQAAPSLPALEDTYCCLAALEIFGALDQIDREACVQGILRRHRGRGYFTSPGPGGYNIYKIEGNARDTFCAFESLRILNGLDHVNDLDRWQFRLPRRSRSSASAATPRKVRWEEIEAWVCRQRFERFLRERKENPQSPPRSLLEP